MKSLTPKRKFMSLSIVALGGFGFASALSIYKNNEAFYRNYIMPATHFLDAENAHKLAIFVTKYRLFPKSKEKQYPNLSTSLLNRHFTNPIGIAAGFDKNAESVLGLFDIGFGFVEVGSVTPLPQFGNEKPRVFRLSADQAVINRYGFNNDGHESVLERLKSLKSHINANKMVIGVNLGKNKTSQNPIDDYVIGVQTFGPYADYLVINISSPNTPGLRSMQSKEILSELLEKTLIARNNLTDNRPSLLLKLSPDMSDVELKDCINVINKCEKNKRIDGLIISNTTISRPTTLIDVSSERQENGGLSGRPLRHTSTEMIRKVHKMTDIPIIGVGGVSSGQDAYEKIKAGASLVQLYTSLVYEGPPVVEKVKRQLSEILKENGFRNVKEAVGSDK